MNDQFECSATAAVLESGAAIALAAHTCAIITGVGSILTASGAQRMTFGASLVLWIIGCWLAVRVAIDAKLFRALAASPDELAPQLDGLLTQWGFIEQPRHTQLAGRTHGAMRLWRVQITLLMLQISAAAIALAMPGAAH